ncbi:MAG: signal peptidase I [Candidatus Saccharimonas sp.]
MHIRLSRKLCVYLVSFFIVLCASSVGTPAYADTDGVCGPQDTPYYNGSLTLSKDVYDVYVKLGNVGQAAAVSGYAQLGMGGRCTTLGSVEGSGNEWRKIGSYRQDGDNTDITFQLSSSVLDNSPNANRPSLMLVSQTNPVCIPTTECFTTIAGQRAYIRPAGTNLESTALHIVRVGSVDLAHVTKVQYYADNEMLYETKTLQEFNGDGVPYYANRQIRVLYYTSGQTAVIEVDNKMVNQFSPWSMIQLYMKKYQSTFIAIGLLIVTIIVVSVVRKLRGYYVHRRLWRLHHGFIHEEADFAVTPAQKHRLYVHNVIRITYQYVERAIIVVGSVAAVVLVVNAFFMQIGTVSGESMYSTLNDGQKILIDKTAVNFAHFNNRQYVPVRGTVVVVSPNFGTIDSSIAQGDGSLIIKRIVGLPGERVVVDGSHVRVYNTTHPDGFDPDVSNKWSANVQYDDSTDHIDVTLSESEVFICGDNRPVSIDSRFNGPISLNQIVGTISGR